MGSQAHRTSFDCYSPSVEARKVSFDISLPDTRVAIASDESDFATQHHEIIVIAVFIGSLAAINRLVVSSSQVYTGIKFWSKHSSRLIELGRLDATRRARVLVTGVH